jgi:hypothetical protein
MESSSVNGDLDAPLEKFNSLALGLEDRACHVRSDGDRRGLIEDLDKALTMYRVLDEMLAMDIASIEAGLDL